MAREVYQRRRTLLVLLLLCLMTYVQSAALVAAIEPHHATGHCCLLCHVGSLPFLQIAGAASVAPITALDRLIINPDVHAWHDVLLNANSSRAPPA